VDLTKSWEMMAEAQLTKMLAKYGHRMVLRKAIPGKKCACMSEVTESPNPNCGKCLGTGDLYTDYMVLGRKYTPRPNVGKEIRSPLGIVEAHSPMFVVETIYRVNTNDMILELVLDDETDEPLRNSSDGFQMRVAYRVTHVSEMRDLRGEKMFFQVRCDERVWGTD
jgi:hypothetical protein